jgi:hypothetical protein
MTRPTNITAKHHGATGGLKAPLLEAFWGKGDEGKALYRECMQNLNFRAQPQARAGRVAPRKPRKPTLVSVAKQANKAAIPVARYEMKPDGTVVVVTGMPSANNTDTNPWDEVLIDAADKKRPS